MNELFNFLVAVLVGTIAPLNFGSMVLGNNDSLSFQEGAEFGTDQVLSIDNTGNLSTEGIISVNDLYIKGTAFISSLNLSEGLFISGNEIIDSTGRIPGLSVDYFANLDGSALTGVNADKLDGIDSLGFVLTGTAIDADKLDGIDSSAFLRSDTSDTAHGALNITAVPGSNSVSGGPLYINPASVTAGYTLFGVAINDSQKFKIDAEGDVAIAGDLSVTGTLSGTFNTTFSTGSVIFQGSSNLTEDSSNLFWDNTNNWLGIGTASPASRLEVVGNVRFDGDIGIGASAAIANAIHFNDTGYIRYTAGSLFEILTFTGRRLDLGTDNAADLTIDTSGNVGIGTVTPASGMSLDVDGLVQIDLGGTQTSVALCGSHSGGSGATVSDVEIVDCTGTPAADYMEMYPVENEINKGSVVVVGSKSVTTKNGYTITQLIKSGKEYQETVIGVVSDPQNAGDFNSIGYDIDAVDNPMPIALSGRVAVEVANYSQEIYPGDFITTSNEPGKAMKAINAGYVIGKAIGSWAPDSEKNTVMIFVNNSYYLGSGLVIDSKSDDFLSFEIVESSVVLATENDDRNNIPGIHFDSETEVLTISRFLNLTKDFIVEGISLFKNVVKFLSEVTFGGPVIFENRVTFVDKDLAGYAKIKSGTNEVRVEFEKEYLFAPVVQITPQGKYDVDYWVSNVSTKDFIIKIDPIYTEEIQFSWLAIVVKDTRTHENDQVDVSPTSTPEPTATPEPTLLPPDEVLEQPDVEPEINEETESS